MSDPTERPDAPIRGLWCATLTPLRGPGAIDHARLAAHAQRLFGASVDGIVLFGTTGEGPSFSVNERRATLEALLAAGIAPSRIVAAAGCASLTDTEDLVRHALSCGIPRCLVLPPFFWHGLRAAAVYRYFATLIEQVADPSLRLYLYHFPQMSGVSIPPGTLSRLAEHYPGIVAGLKDSGADFPATLKFLEAAPQLSILVGHEADIARLLRAGGAGTICGAANLFPRIVRSLFNPDGSPEAERRLATLLQILARHPFVPSFKAALAGQLDDRCWSEVQPPLMRLSDTDIHRLEHDLKNLADASGLVDTLLTTQR